MFSHRYLFVKDNRKENVDHSKIVKISETEETVESNIDMPDTVDGVCLSKIRTRKFKRIQPIVNARKKTFVSVHEKNESELDELDSESNESDETDESFEDSSDDINSEIESGEASSS